MNDHSAPSISPDPLSRIPAVLLISGTRQCGKDTLCDLLKEVNPAFVRFAFADGLKEDLHPFILKHYGIDVFTVTGAEKELIRPLMIAHGCAKRELDVDCWVKQAVEAMATEVSDRIFMQDNTAIVPVCVDGRFTSEVSYLRRTFGSRLFHLNLTRDGSPPPTAEEEKHYRQVAALADRHLEWGGSTEEQRRGSARWVASWVTGGFV